MRVRLPLDSMAVQVKRQLAVVADFLCGSVYRVNVTTGAVRV